MSKALILKIETQTENREVISICHVNEKMLSLETSYVASQMLKLNRELFDKINKTTKIIGGSLYRQEVTQAKETTNRLSVPILETRNHREFEISKLFFENNVLTKQQRAINRYGRKFDFDPNTVSNLNTGGFFDEKRPSPDDIRDSTIITTVEEISLFEPDGIKTFLITDNLERKISLLEVGYRIELIIDTEFDSYVDFVFSQVETSLNFLNSYLNVLQYPSSYDNKNRKFNDNYANRIMTELGLSFNLSSANVSTARVRQSEFGQVGIAYYNLLLLLKEGVNKNVYLKTLENILPTQKTTPDKIDSFIRRLSSTLLRARRAYLRDEKQLKDERKFPKGSKSTPRGNFVETTSIEKLSIEQERLGYSVFSENSTGLNNFSIGGYQDRIVSEQTRHYPVLNVQDTSKFLRPAERIQFSDTSNAAAFLTPVKMIMGNQEISTTRGMVNIPINQVRQFRLAKSARFSQKNSSKFPQSISRGRIDIDSISSFNVTIAEPLPALLERPFILDIDPLRDAKHYVGRGSEFATSNPLALLKQYKRILSKDDLRTLEIASDIVPRRFLRNNKAIKSIKEIQFSNKKSRVRKMANAGELDIASIPPQVKFMMSAEFNPNPESDPLKNRESRQIIEETQKNLFVIRALVGFKQGENGFLDVYNPMYQDMKSSVFETGNPILAKAYDYEIPELGIVKDNFAATIYNNLIYIRR